MSDENFFTDLVPAEKPAQPEPESTGGGYFADLVPERSVSVLGGKLAGKEDAFIEAGIRHDVDPKLLMAMSMFETGNGKSHMVRTKNNVGGLTEPGNPNTYRTFASLDDSIETMARTVRRGYIDKGLTTIAQIGARYAPPGASNDPNRTNAEWPNAVAANYQKLSSPEIQRRIAEFPAIAGEVTGQAVREAGKAGATDAGIFSDLVPKKGVEEKAAPPAAKEAEDTGIFSDLVPPVSQPVKIEEPPPMAPPPPPQEEGAPPPAAVPPGMAAPATAGPQPTPLVPSVDQEQQAQQAAQLQQGAQQAAAAAGQVPLPTAQQAAQIPSLEPQVVAPPVAAGMSPAPPQQTPSYFLAKAGVMPEQAAQMAPGPQIPVTAGAGEGLKETAADLAPHSIEQFRGLAQMMGSPSDPKGFFMSAVKAGLVDAQVAKKAIEKGPLSREAGYAYARLIPQWLMMRAGVKAPLGPVLARPGIEPPPVQVPLAVKEQPGTVVQTTNEALAKAVNQVRKTDTGGHAITVPVGDRHLDVILTRDGELDFTEVKLDPSGRKSYENLYGKTGIGAFKTMNALKEPVRKLITEAELEQPGRTYKFSTENPRKQALYRRVLENAGLEVNYKGEFKVPPELRPGRVTSTKNAVVDAERQARGLSPILDEAVQSNQATMAAAEARLAANPDYGRALVADLVAGTKKGIDAVDEAVLLREKIRAQNERALAGERTTDASLTDSERALATERFQEAENYISDIDLATYRSGQNWGRMGQFRQRLARDDYSLVTMESRMRIAKGNKPLNADELAVLEKQVNDLEKAQGKRQAKEQRDLEATRERLERRVAQMKGLEPAVVKAQRLSIEDLEIETLRTELAKLKEREFEARRLPKAKERVAQKIKEIEHRINTYGYAERFRREALKPDRELRELQYRVREAQEKLNKGIVEARWKNQGKVQRFVGNIFRASTLPRALQASADLSYLLRQGKIMLMSRPLTTIRTFGETLKAGFGTRYAEALAEARTKPGGPLGVRQPFQIFNAASKRGYNDIMERIRNDPHYHESKYEGGVSYTDVEPGGKLRNAEEAYQSAWADAIPIVRESQRAYVAFLNLLRLEGYKALKATWGNNGEFTPMQAKLAGNYMNVVTGRGNLNLPMGLNLEAAAVGMGQVFFAPRYRVSRFQYIGGQPLLYGIQLAEGRTAGAMRMRAVLAGEYARAMAGYSVYYSLLYMAARTFGGGQVTIGNDPRSSDFGKVVTGNTRIDPLAGLSQASVFVGRSASGQTVSSRTGQVQNIRGQVPYGKPTWFDVAARFIRGSLSPNFSAGVDLIQGTDFRYRPVTLSSEAVRLITPLSSGDMIDSMQEQGFTAGAALSVLTLLGENVQTYSPRLTQTPSGIPMLVPPPPPPAPPPPPPVPPR